MEHFPPTPPMTNAPNPFACMPGQIAAALIQVKGYNLHVPEDLARLADETVTICDALAKRMKQSTLWAPIVVNVGGSQNERDH